MDTIYFDLSDLHLKDLKKLRDMYCNEFFYEYSKKTYVARMSILNTKFTFPYSRLAIESRNKKIRKKLQNVLDEIKKKELI
jgi:hypothetical protein